VLGRGIDDRLRSRSPDRRTQRGCFLQEESRHIQRPGEDRACPNQFDLERWSARSLNHAEETPEAAGQAELPTPERGDASIRLADRSGQCELAAGGRIGAARTADAGATAAVDGGPGEVKWTAALAASDGGEHGREQCAERKRVSDRVEFHGMDFTGIVRAVSTDHLWLNRSLIP